MVHFALGIILLMRLISSELVTQSKINRNQHEGLTILGSGIYNLIPDAMGISFYVSLENTFQNEVDVATRMWECCETFVEGEIDCSHIHLVGGYKGIIRSGDSKNVSLFYPNLYVYNRVGECLVGIWYKNQIAGVTELRTKIRFDTTLSQHYVSPSIKAYYRAEEKKIKICSNVDEDVLNNCNPVDCSRKYNGQRNYYSYIERRCEPTARCTADPQNSIYFPDGNVCSSVDPVITEDDIKTLNTGRGVDQELHQSHEHDFIICHHGKKSKFTGSCTCDPEWFSPSYQTRPTSLPSHFCLLPKLEVQDASSSLLDDFMESASAAKPTAEEISRNYYKLIIYALFAVLISCTFLSVIIPHIYLRMNKKVKNTPPSFHSRGRPKRKLADECHRRSVDEWIHNLCIGKPNQSRTQDLSPTRSDSLDRDFSTIEDVNSFTFNDISLTLKESTSLILADDSKNEDIKKFTITSSSNTFEENSPNSLMVTNSDFKKRSNLEAKTNIYCSKCKLRRNPQNVNVFRCSNLINPPAATSFVKAQTVENHLECCNTSCKIEESRANQNQDLITKEDTVHDQSFQQCENHITVYKHASDSFNILKPKEQQERNNDSNSVSKTMAQWTYSSLPSSNTLLSLKISDESDV